MRFIGILILLISVAGCSETKAPVKKPDGLMDHKKMALVLADVHELEGALLTRYPNIRNRIQPMHDPSIAQPQGVPASKDSIPYFDIFKKRGITREEFTRSFNWYCTNPEILSEIYGDVITELTRRQTEKLHKKQEIR